jgi:RNA polymerase sigma factor (sigma-70 family)
MSSLPRESASVSELLQLTQAGDQVALNTLIERSGTRLRNLARHMLNGSPALRRWAGSDDVLQNSLIRLVRALEAVKPDSSRDFFGLAALQMRRELIDLARHFYGPRGHGANHESGTDERLLDAGVKADANQPDAMAQWAELHEHIGQLDESQREIVDLIFYQGLNQTETAEVLGVSVRTVQRRWHTVLLKLNEFLEGSGLSLNY